MPTLLSKPGRRGASAARTATLRSAGSLRPPRPPSSLGTVLRALVPLPAASILPKAVKAPCVHLRIAGRVGNLAMPEMGRQGAGVDPTR